MRSTPSSLWTAGRVKVRENQRVLNKALYLALGVDMEGQKELLGMWMSQSEGATFWLSVFTELQNRGVKDIFIACMDGLIGLPEAVETLYPHTRVQLCMVHMVRNSECVVLPSRWEWRSKLGEHAIACRELDEGL